jgi:drug/metabolite transporter (DMT)-like permease
MFPIIGVLAGIGAAAGWGVGDFFAGKSSRRIGPFPAAFLSVFLGFCAAIVIYLLLSREFGAPPLDVFVKLAFLMLLLTVAQIAFYKALEIGPVGIVATLGSAYPMLTVPLAIIFLGERLTLIQLAAISIVILGVILTSIQIGGKKIVTSRKLGVFLALTAMVLWGVSFAFWIRWSGRWAGSKRTFWNMRSPFFGNW